MIHLFCKVPELVSHQCVSNYWCVYVFYPVHLQRALELTAVLKDLSTRQYKHFKLYYFDNPINKGKYWISFGGYIGIALSVRLCIFLISATTPKQTNQYKWNLTQLQYMTWGCAWRRTILVEIIPREMIICAGGIVCDLTRIPSLNCVILQACVIIYVYNHLYVIC